MISRGAEERRKRAGSELRAQRERQGVTQVQLAERLAERLGEPVGQVSISYWESGRSAPEAWKVPAIEDVLGFEPGALTSLWEGRRRSTSAEPPDLAPSDLLVEMRRLLALAEERFGPQAGEAQAGPPDGE